MSKRNEHARMPGGLVCAFPYCDLDGTPHPGCDHQFMTRDPVELAVLRGVAEGVVAAGLPTPFVRAGEPIRTTWGCERNKRLTHREAVVTNVTVCLYRDHQSMWYRPCYEYIGRDEKDEGMVLRQIERRDGRTWEAPKHFGDIAPFHFRLEWVSPIHGGIERAYQGAFADQPLPETRSAAATAEFVAWVTECRPDMESDVEFCEAKALSNRGAAARRKLAAIDVFLAAVAANGPTEADPS